MANQVVINGDHRRFALNSQIKLYALIDAGFHKTRIGNYEYSHPLYNNSPYNAPTQLKLRIDKNLSHLSMVITDRNGLQKVNIFKNKKLAPTVQLLNYILQDLEERKILTKVKD